MALHALEALAVILVTVVLVRVFDAQRLPDLKPWHRLEAIGEWSAAELTDRVTLENYIDREKQVFEQTRKAVEAQLGPEDRTAGNRYAPESPMNPARFATDWNRTFELTPEILRGGVLLIHGLTDGPYSVRRVAEIYKAQGFYALALRLPGHGTIPGALVRATKEDWLAAVRLGARHVRQRIGPDRPFHVVGYSAGAALVLLEELETLGGGTRPADRILLLSPMIGVSRVAALARAAGSLSMLPFFEKARWLDVLPEYIPFKYNSFPASAARQTWELTQSLRSAMGRAADSGALAKLPPALAFQSLADATVSTESVVSELFDRVPENGSELVLFDVNRQAYLKPFLRSPHEELLSRLTAGSSRRYRFSLVTNAGADTPNVVVRSFPPGGGASTEETISLAWPRLTFSLSHVAIPFPPDDPLYGSEPDPKQDYGIRLGAIHPRGERDVLSVPADNLIRLTSNPFFPYVERRIAEWVGSERLRR